jgi:hypothetical protein
MVNLRKPEGTASLRAPSNVLDPGHPATTQGPENPAKAGRPGSPASARKPAHPATAQGPGSPPMTRESDDPTSATDRGRPANALEFAQDSPRGPMPPFPLRLPPEWVRVDPVGDSEMAVLPSDDGDGRPVGVLTVTALSDAGPPPAVAAEEALTTARRTGISLVIIDEGTAHCRGDTPAYRVLTAHTQGGRGITTELWLVGGDRPATLCAAVDTAHYAELGPVLHRMLRSYGSRYRSYPSHRSRRGPWNTADD